VGTAAADTAAAGIAVAAGTVAAADTDESVIVTERSPGTTRRMCILYNFLIVPPLRNHWDRDVSIITSLRSTYESLISRAHLTVASPRRWHLSLGRACCRALHAWF
jgi:hypothetical protein